MEKIPLHRLYIQVSVIDLDAAVSAGAGGLPGGVLWRAWPKWPFQNWSFCRTCQNGRLGMVSALGEGTS